ncbi:MerR family transcriptional regulator [Lactiplantibacillus daowaiensis]|uniref:MerR family transcriptional regulator n=1 Tax=Lactiplantibacillus daowaiensis TaxID=2559918 RepID=A0ABW1S196_9LACO|nr:MerR family transcriptional regulator [Lactiplantibacillus daowaiensis]
MTYSIGQVAEKLSVTVDTLRYYDKAGLLPFVKRNAAGRREFTDNDLHLMRTIMCLKNAGVPVNEIATFVQLRLQGDTSLDERYQLLLAHEQNLKTKILDLQETLAYLQYKKWYYETAVAAGTEAIHFLPGSNEVDPQLARQYQAHLKEIGDLTTLALFNEVIELPK